MRVFLMALTSMGMHDQLYHVVHLAQQRMRLMWGTFPSCCRDQCEWHMAIQLLISICCGIICSRAIAKVIPFMFYVGRTQRPEVPLAGARSHQPGGQPLKLGTLQGVYAWAIIHGREMA